MEPICGQELHKIRRNETGKCSGDLMICYNFNPRAKDKHRRDIYRCERHALHIMSFDHMKYVKFVYINIERKRKEQKQGEGKMKCYWNEDVLCLEPESKKDKDALVKFQKLFKDSNKTITEAGALGFLLDFADEGIQAFTDRGVETGEPTVEIVHGSKRVKVKRGRPKKIKDIDSSKEKVVKRGRGRPKGSRNKPKTNKTIGCKNE